MPLDFIPMMFIGHRQFLLRPFACRCIKRQPLSLHGLGCCQQRKWIVGQYFMLILVMRGSYHEAMSVHGNVRSSLFECQFYLAYYFAAVLKR